ncbi:MAG: hypothetical protein FWC34_10590 [Bacteroidetes bacterium]|nr:hypothetical protein [Bacteroidota bacterium]MCL2302546.1 hypothetical protein [Lentimicrobiaceae bacterium]
MKELTEVLTKLWPRKYWILGITLLITIVGLAINMPSIIKTEYKATAELHVVNIPDEIKTDFHKYAIRLTKKDDVSSALSQKFNLKDPKINVSFGKNRNICFSAVNSDPQLAEEMVEELIRIFNHQINNVVDAVTITHLEKIDHIITLKQQQTDSVRQRLIHFYEQKGMTYIPNSYLSGFERTNNTNSIARMKPIQPLAAEKGVDIFAEETMLFNCIFDLNHQMNRRNSTMVQLNTENNYVGIVIKSDPENPVKVFRPIKFLIEIIILGLSAGVLLFLILDFGVPAFKSFRKQMLDNIKHSDKTT